MHKKLKSFLLVVFDKPYKRTNADHSYQFLSVNDIIVICGLNLDKFSLMSDSQDLVITDLVG